MRRFAAFLLCASFTLAHAHNQLGANLNFIADFFRNHEFNDLVKQSRAFLKAGSHFDDGNPADRATVGPDGWPTEDFKLFAMTAQAGVTGLGGTYKLVFTGQATIVATGATIQNKVYDAGTNTTRADVVFPAGGDTLFIDFTATGGTVKDVRLLRPGVPEVSTPLLTPTWSAHTSRFTVLRFLDWTRTNGNRHIAWSDRTTPQKLRTETLIAQWETVIAAANALNRDPWINVPVQASDEYVTNLATLFRDTLNSNLNLYVEYGNELWNFGLTDQGMDAFNGGGSFNGATVNRDAANAGGADPSLGAAFAGDLPPDATARGFRRVALRLKQVSDIFKAVWGPSAINTRVRPVLAGQMANSFIVNEGLRYVDEILNVRPDTVFYALAGAPYIFASANADANADETPGLTKDQILDGMQAGVGNAGSESVYQYLSHAGLGAWYGLKVLAYEAGFDNFGSQNIPAKRDANLDPRIKTICKDYVNAWHAMGFGTLMWFNAGAASYSTQFGMWPLLEDMGSPAQPKNQCMDEILAAALPAVTVGTSATAGPIPGGSYRGGASPSGPITGGEGVLGFPGYAEYLVRADLAGTYNLTFTGSAPAGETFRVKLNNATVAANVVLPTTTGTSSAISVTLRQGLNALRIERSVGGSWSIASFAFTLVSAGPSLSLSTSSLDFGGQSMGTTSPSQTFTFSNAGGGTLTVDSVVSSSPQFTVSHSCTPAPVCTVTVTFTPAPTGAALNADPPVPGQVTITTNASGSPHAVSLTGRAEKSLVTHFYRAILRRAPDAPGKAFWQGEAARLQSIGANVNEAWYALAQFFYFSAEYASFNRDNPGFVTDLYTTFFNRAPDGGGLAFWVNELASGMPREVVLAGFMFSAEFSSFTQAIFGNTAARAEVDTVMDFYRGMLARTPDPDGFTAWVNNFRAAQCQGGAAVNNMVETISSNFAGSGEYLGRNRTNAQYVGDLYNAFLRRGGDLGGVQFWINDLDASTRSRENVRQNFLASPEFQGRVGNIIAQGCMT